jgi:hypothetical protein
MRRCHASHVRTSYSSNPQSCLAISKPISMDHRRPANPGSGSPTLCPPAEQRPRSTPTRSDPQDFDAPTANGPRPALRPLTAAATPVAKPSRTPVPPWHHPWSTAVAGPQMATPRRGSGPADTPDRPATVVQCRPPLAAIHLIARHPAARHAGVERALDHRQRQRWLGAKRHRLGHVRLGAAYGVGGPVLGQVRYSARSIKAAPYALA